MNKEESSNLPQATIAIINDNIYSDRIYCFGVYDKETERKSVFESGKLIRENKIHYCLLVISQLKGSTGAHLQRKINGIPDSDIEVTIVLHPIQEARKQIENGNYFFCKVFQEGKLVYIKDKEQLNLDPPVMHELGAFKDREEQSNFRFNRAMSFLKAGRTMMANNLTETQMETILCFMADGMEQACLGLIYLHLGYEPNYHKLSHLTNLCKHFWHQFDAFLPLLNGYDQVLFKVLVNIRSNVRYKVIHEIEEGDYRLISFRASHFIQMAETFYISTISEQPTVN